MTSQNQQRFGWAAPLALVLVAALLSIVQVSLLLIVPLALALIALPPHRPLLMIFGLALLAVALVAEPGDLLWWVGRGWALIVGAWFVGVVALWPRTGFIDRGLLAVFGATLSTGLLFLTDRADWQRLDGAVSQTLREQTAASLESVWPRINNAEFAQQLRETYAQTIEWLAAGYPAMLALASLCGLGVVWWLWRRLTAREPRPLQRLREFRFADEWVWLFLGALGLILLPLGAAFTRLGANLAALMAALYALRGLAVMIVLYQLWLPQSMMLGSVLLLLLLLLFPLTLGPMLALGVGDTWLDLRARRSGPELEQTNEP